MKLIQDIEKLAQLKDKGILTEGEFQQKKAEMLAPTYAEAPGASVADDNAAATGSLTVPEKLLVEQRLLHEKPRMLIAYVLWFFTNVLGGHRFYLGKSGSAVTMCVLSLTGFGLIVTIPWAFIDLFLIPRMIRQKVAAIRYKLTQLPL